MDRISEIRGAKRKSDLGLEVGPYFAPVFPKRDGWNVLTVDIACRDELVSRAIGDPNIASKSDLIEDVDFIYRGDLMTTVRSAAFVQEFDYIVSSHNFEHQPNPIQFLIDCFYLLKEGGCLTMAIPVGSKCFDKLCPLSTTGQIIDSYYDKRRRPTPGQHIDSVLSGVMSSDGGSVSHSDYRLNELQSLNLNVDKHWNSRFYESTIQAAVDERYMDTHCWVFNPDSFQLILQDLSMLGLVEGLGVARIVESGIEFIVDIVKCSGAMSAGLSRVELLARAVHRYSRDQINLFPL